MTVVSGSGTLGPALPGTWDQQHGESAQPVWLWGGRRRSGAGQGRRGGPAWAALETMMPVARGMCRVGQVCMGPAQATVFIIYYFPF